MPDSVSPRHAERFAALLDPVPPERFLTEHLGVRPLHVPGDRARVADVMSWDRLQALLDMTSIWTPESLRLMLDRQRVPAAEYCTPTLAQNKQTVLRPDPRRVSSWLRRGASLVCNDIDALGPGLSEVSAALEAVVGGRAQANLYCSRAERQAFASHYDTHEVFALHCEGEKTWRIYENRAEAPIAHPRFTGGDEAQHDRAKGGVLMEVTLRPGDLLYLPRGQYHDALAASQGTIHVAFGVTRPIGLDALSMLWERALEDPLFRADLPRPAGTETEAETGGALAARLAELGRRAAALAADPAFAAAVAETVRATGYARDRYDLAAAIEASPGYELAGGPFRLAESAPGAWRLAGPRAAVPVPESVRPLTAWVLARRRFTRSEIDGAFAAVPSAMMSKFLADMTGMGVLRPAD